MTIKPDSVSYPTLAVIVHHDIPEVAKTPVWMLSWAISNNLRDNLSPYASLEVAECRDELRRLIGHDATVKVVDHLVLNLRRARKFMQEMARA